MLARDAGPENSVIGKLLHGVRKGAPVAPARIQSTVNAIAVLGFTGSLIFLAVWLAASLRPHLRGIVD